MIKIPTFQIDDTNSDDETFWIDIASRTATIRIHLADDGLVVDMWSMSVSDGPVTSMWATNSELSGCN